MSEQEYAPAWRPDAGDEISGRVVQLDARESDYGPYPILTLEDEGGTQVAVHCVHGVLRREIARRYEPTAIVGQQMRIKYEGKQKTRDGKRDFHNYRVFGGNKQSTYDWSQDLPEEERRPASSAQPPIAASEDFSPLPASTAPSVQQKAEQSFGSDAPF